MISRSAYAQLRYSPLRAGGHRRRHGAGLSCAAAAGAVRPTGRRAGWACAWLVMAAHLPADAALLSSVAALGAGASCHRRRLHGLHRSFRATDIWRGRGGLWKGRVQAMKRVTHERARQISPPARDTATRIFRWPRGSMRAAACARRSSPSTASRARPTISPTTRRPCRTRSLRELDRMEAGLRGETAMPGEGVRLRVMLCRRGSHARHALDLLEAFRRDVTKLRYADWDELMDYCRYSAMPVGRFVLDVHGEDRRHLGRLRRVVRRAAGHQPSAGLRQGLSGARPGLCAARCARARSGLGDRGAGRAKASPALRRCIARLARRTDVLLRDARRFADGIATSRLALRDRRHPGARRQLLGICDRRDPLAERVHHRPKRAASPCVAARHRRGSGAPARPRNPAGTARTAGPRASPMSTRSGRAFRQLVLHRRCGCCRAPSARRCSRSTCSVARSTTSPTTARDRGRRAPRRWRNGAATSMRSTPAGRPARRASCASRSGLGLRREDFLAVIDGMEMDVEADIRAPDAATLDLYCDRVPSPSAACRSASSAWTEAPGAELAHQLGRALQLTNILRDLDEDADDRPALPAARAAGAG